MIQCSILHPLSEPARAVLLDLLNNTSIANLSSLYTQIFFSSDVSKPTKENAVKLYILETLTALSNCKVVAGNLNGWNITGKESNSTFH